MPPSSSSSSSSNHHLVRLCASVVVLAAAPGQLSGPLARAALTEAATLGLRGREEGEGRKVGEGACRGVTGEGWDLVYARGRKSHGAPFRGP